MVAAGQNSSAIAGQLALAAKPDKASRLRPAQAIIRRAAELR
jgi:hypothetical protein